MTRVIKLILAFTLLMMFSCNENRKNKDLPVSNTTEARIPHNSDVTFAKALKALSNKEYEVAGKWIIEGTDELKAEANELMEDQKPNLLAELVLFSNMEANLIRMKMPK